MKITIISSAQAFLRHFFNKIFAQNLEKTGQTGDDFLKKEGKRVADFASEEEKKLHLVRHLPAMETFYHSATEISNYKNKSPELLAALQKLVIQCLLHYEINRKHQYRGILTAIFENSPDLNREYLPLLEDLAGGNSKFQTSEYLKSIALEAITHSSVLFSLSDKIKILANKQLLKINRNHASAAPFFLNYPGSRSTKKQVYYFTASDNNWSGHGLVNEHGEWILPPFYDFQGSDNAFPEGIATVRLISDYRISGNWIDVNGRFLFPFFMSEAGRFFRGKARCEVDRKIKYIDRNGTFLDIQNPEDISYLENGYARRTAGGKVQIIDDQGKTLRSLDKKYKHIIYKPDDKLISYGSTDGWPGEGKFGYMDMQGNILTEAVYYTSSDFSYDSGSFKGRDIMVLRYEYNQVGLVNKQFKTLIPFQYDDIRIINQKYIVAEKGGHLTLFDCQGKIIPKEVPERFKKVYFTTYEGSIGISEKNGFGRLIDEDGELVKGLENFHAAALKHGFISLKKKKWGVLDYQFNAVLPFIFDQIALISNQVILTRLDGLFQTHHLPGGETYDFPAGLKPEEYGPRFNEEFIILMNKGKAGVLNLKGEIILPFVFQSIMPGKPIEQAPRF